MIGSSSRLLDTDAVVDEFWSTISNKHRHFPLDRKATGAVEPLNDTAFVMVDLLRSQWNCFLYLWIQRNP